MLISRVATSCAVLVLLMASATAQTPDVTFEGPAEGLLNEEACFSVQLTNIGDPGYQPYLRLFVPQEFDAESVNVSLLGEAVTSIVEVGTFSGATLTDPNLPDEDPLDAVSGTAGQTLMLVNLPVGSLIEGGVSLNVNICATMDGPGASVNVPIDLQVQTIYRYGDTPTGENGAIAGDILTTTITPSLYNVSHGVNQSSATPGNCIPLEVAAVVNIAQQEIVNGLTITEELPAGFLYLDVMEITPGCIVTQEPTQGQSGTLVVTCNNVAGTDAPDDIILSYAAMLDDVLDPASCAPVELEASGTVTSSQEATVTDPINVVAQHVVVTPLSPTLDPLPGATVVFGAQILAQEFIDGVDEAMLTMTIPDGTTYTGNAQLNATSVTAVSETANGDGSTTLVFDLHAANGEDFASCAFAQFTFTALIEETYQDGTHVAAGDALEADGSLSYSLTGEAGTCEASVAPGYSILASGFEKSIVSTPADGTGFVPGEEVTYRLSLLIPSGDAREVSFQDFFPIPIHDVTTISTVFGEDIVLAPTDNAGLTPQNISIDANTNSLIIDWGTIETPTSGSALIVAVDVTIAISSEPFADGLTHSNFARFFSDDAQGVTAGVTDLVTFAVGAPELDMFKGVVTTDQPDAVYAPVMVPVNANVSWVDAWDFIDFRITFVNTGDAPAYDVIVNDFPPSPQLGQCLVNGVTDGNGDPLNYSGNLFTAGLVIESIPKQQSGSSGHIAMIDYECRVQGQVDARSSFSNEATATWSAVPGSPLQFNPITEVASVSTARPEMQLEVVDIQPGYASNGGLHIGELITFDLLAEIPEGFTRNAEIEFTLPEGLSVEEVVDFEVPEDMSFSFGSNAQVANAIEVLDVDGTNEGLRRIVRSPLGDVHNAAADNLDKEFIRIRVSAVVLNTAVNQNGHLLEPIAELSYLNPVSGVNVITDASLTFDIREPELDVELNFLENELLPGDQTFVTVSVGHAPGSTGDAFNVSLLNDLPIGLTFVSGSFINECETLMGEVPTNNFGSITAEWDSIPLGVTCELVYLVDVASTFPACTTTENCMDIGYASAFDLHMDTLSYGPVNPIGLRRTGNTNNPGGANNDYLRNSCDQLEVVASNLSTPTIVGADAYCEGESLVLTIPEYAGTIVEYNWSGPGVPAGYNNAQLVIPAAEVDDSGSYDVHVQIGQCVTETSIPVSVTVNPVPVADVDNLNIPCASGFDDAELLPLITGGEGPFSFEWSGPNFFSTDSVAVIENADEANSGVYSLLVTDQNGCSAPLASAQVNISTAPPLPQLIAGATVCEGDALMLSANPYPGAETYTWQTPSGEIQTTGPNLNVEAAELDLDGPFTVTVQLEDCATEPSNEVNVTVNAQPETPVFTANDNELCAGETLVLTTVATADTYAWSGPNGFSASGQAPPAIEAITVLGDGNYSLVVTSNGCSSEPFVLPVTVHQLPSVPGLGSNSPLCEGDALLLSTSAEAEGYEWTLPGGATELTNSGSLMIQDTDAGDAGDYALSVFDGTCWSLASDAEAVQVDVIPNEQAAAGNDRVACIDESLVVEASNGDEFLGQWSTNDTDLSIASPNSNATSVSGMVTGSTYTLTWSLYTEGCGVYSTDQITVVAPEAPTANDDVAEMLQDEFIDLFVVDNDTPGPVGYNISLVDLPDNGTAQVSGDDIIEYRPNDLYAGEDELIYELCLDACPSMCDTAIVRLQVFPILRIPDVVTPNNDGMNDTFEIEGIDRFPDNELFIYNRWGREIYSAENYANEWDATFNGTPVPNGTYFYVLNNKRTGEELGQGYITIHQ